MTIRYSRELTPALEGGVRFVSAFRCFMATSLSKGNKTPADSWVGATPARHLPARDRKSVV